MKLQELAAPKASKQISRVFESYFGSSIQFDRLTGSQAQKMLRKVRQVLGEHRSTTARHHSERDPNYLKLVMMEQALASRVSEDMVPPTTPGAVTTAKPGTPTAQQTTAANAAATIATTQDPKLKAALTKASKGQALTPDEQKMVSGVALMKTENRLLRAYRTLKESEVQQAQVVLAAQDMVDKMQKMIEDTTSMQFKELPALVDSIRNQIGIDQATQFNTDASAALAGLVQNLQGSKQQLESALGVVTGQAPSGDTSMGADMGADIGADIGADVGANMGAEPVDDLGAEPVDDLDAGAPAPAAALGRKRR